MFDLQNQVALITGAAHPQGIGHAIAEVLGKQGATLALIDIDEQHLEESVGRFEDRGIKTQGYNFDVSQPEAVNSQVASIIQKFGKVDILVNNVGGSSRISREELNDQGAAPSSPAPTRRPFLGVSNATSEQWEKILNVNLNAGFYCSRAVLPNMIRNRHGRIVNVASVVARRGVRKDEVFSSGPYAVAKAGVIGFTRQLALEVAEYGITVNCIAPGIILSQRGARIESLLSEQEFEQLLKEIPLGRLGKTDEVAHVVLGLCTDQFSYVTGQTIDVNGGMY